jgi:hypothetical protein
MLLRLVTSCLSTLALASGVVAISPAAHAASSEPQLVVHEQVTIQPGRAGQRSYTMYRSIALADPSLGETTQATAIGYGSNCMGDGGIRVKICAAIDYDNYSSGGYSWVSINSVRTSASRLDSGASLTKLGWTAYQLGACGIGCRGTIAHRRSGSHVAPASGAWYAMNTGWAGQYQRLSPNPFDVAGLQQTLSYAFRGASLSLSQDLGLH